MFEDMDDCLNAQIDSLLNGEDIGKKPNNGDLEEIWGFSMFCAWSTAYSMKSLFTIFNSYQ